MGVVQSSTSMQRPRHGTQLSSTPSYGLSSQNHRPPEELLHSNMPSIAQLYNTSSLPPPSTVPRQPKKVLHPRPKMMLQFQRATRRPMGCGVSSMREERTKAWML